MNDQELFETDRLTLTGWRPDQLPDLMALHGDPATARYLSADGHAWTEAEAAKSLALWIEIFATHRMGKLRLIRKTDGAFIGRAGFGLHPPTSEPEIGYALLPQYRGMGYATEAATGLRDWIFQNTDWDHFIGFADVRNAPSLAILTGIGMTKTHVDIYHGISAQFHIMHRPTP
ncbi:GNAT family N-acetyltransferase [Devosia rhodophyticola]|uniref:GNAT family N-acetyltransferase n=1 Tax=Devosia rhodophyticola TaxID=3026423 RepID=A0ABY7YVZ2_9HYPH|nr:GNAT family N-acetyltransferase [Devosia rhodophyticola]WDR05109.1 GNAT family N-acetyltransferase [Devosia rhodophyticola]